MGEQQNAPTKQRVGSFQRAVAHAVRFNESTGLSYIVVRNPIRSGFDVLPEKDLSISATVLFAARDKGALSTTPFFRERR